MGKSYQPDIDLMNYLAGASTSASDSFTALHQEGYGGDNAPVSIDNPESVGGSVGKAVSLVICYYAVKYKESSVESVTEKMMIPLMAVVNALSEETNDSTIKELVSKYLKKEGRWESLIRSGGFDDGSVFGRKIERIKGGVIGGDTDEKRMIFALSVLAVFVGRWATGERKILNNLYAYARVYHFLNSYYRNENPTMGLLNIDEPTLRWLHYDDHSNVFLEIEHTSNKDSAHEYTMFGFEDLTEVFKDPVDPQLMKDAELQAYTLRGELMYDEWWWYHVPYCEDKHVPVTNPQGKVTGYNNIGPTNFPCINEAKNIVPVTGTLFERTFIEAPPVSGTYDGSSKDFIATKTRENYPAGTAQSNASIETYISVGDNRYITAARDPQGGNGWGSYVSDVSHYEPYYFIDNHETSAGNPFPGWGCTLPTHNGWCDNGYHGNNAYYPLDYLCTGAGYEWIPWTQTCLSPAPPSPKAFPEGFTRDMSLRHSLIREDADTSLNYWEDLGSWEWTGFVMAPLMFTPERVEGSYKEFLQNPKMNAGSLGRRAFAFSPKPTAGVAPGTCGPPQPGGSATERVFSYNNEGGPFVYAQVYAENKTKRQRASVNIFPGWAYRYRQDPYGTYDLHRTGGWNFPLITMTAYSLGYSDPMESFQTQTPHVEFYGKKISNNYNEDGARTFLYNGETECWLQGTGVNPQTNERYEACWKNSAAGGVELLKPYDPMQPQPDPFHYNQELIVPHKFFGMGDGCQDVPVITSYSMNAGVRYPINRIDVTGITHRYLKHHTGEFANIDAEKYFEDFIIGQWGDNYWDEFVTGWINTGAYAGETVHCLHPRTGISTIAGSPKQIEYYWLGTGIGDVHPNFPYNGIDCLTNFGPLSPYPNYSKCCEIGFTPPINGVTTTTTTTADPSATTTTTTSCDPNDPNCQGTPSTTTTTTVDPLYMDCDNGIPLSCPDGKTPEHGYYPTNGVCSWEQCVDVGCTVDDHCNFTSNEEQWDSGIWPHEHDWVEQKTKQANENMPRYWHGPYASTYFRFMYPHAEQAFSGQYPPGKGYEITGFPAQVKFKVNIEEWIVKDWVSGGYINENGEITWDKVMPVPAPEFKNETGDYNWGNFVDENYVPKVEGSNEPEPLNGEGESSESPVSYHGTDEMDGAIVLDWQTANGRNIETYDANVFFDRGNKDGNVSLYRYGTSVENSINEKYVVTYGGFHRYTGYSFPMTSSYVKPTYDLRSLDFDYTSMTNALREGNEIYYDCSKSDWVNFNEDPVYFMSMVSNLNYSGLHSAGLGTTCSDTIEGGPHPAGIYGDRWIGLRAKSLFTEFTSNGEQYGSSVAGNLNDWIDCDRVTGSCDIDEQQLLDDISLGCLADDDKYYYCESATSDCFGEKTSFHEDWVTTRACDYRVWLFNVSPSGIDVHVRAPDFISGYNVDSSMYSDDSFGYNLSNACDIVSWQSPDTATLSFTITGTDTYVRFYDAEELAGTEAAFSNPNNVQLDLFKREWLDGREINFEQIVYEKAGVLFEKEKLTGDWELENGVYETVYGYGKRLIESENERVRVSGWKESSKLKINITDITLGNYGEVPSEEYWAMESSGNCIVSGDLRYNYQREASIYSEGIVLEDKSDDSLRDVLEYPHYASEVIKRPGIQLPYTPEYESEEFVPDEVPWNKKILSAPSRMIVRRNEMMTMGTGLNNYEEILRGGPYYYNRYVWPTLSDAATWNGGSLSWEGYPEVDRDVYPVTQLMISAAAGQPYANNLDGEFIQKKYAVTQHKGFYDGVVLDPTINTEWIVDLPIPYSYMPNSSYLVPKGTSINDIKVGIVPAIKHTLEPPGEGAGGNVVGVLT